MQDRPSIPGDYLSSVHSRDYKESPCSRANCGLERRFKGNRLSLRDRRDRTLGSKEKIGNNRFRGGNTIDHLSDQVSS